MLESYGIIHQVTCPYNPQQNARVERKHKCLLNIARALHMQANIPLKYWGECILAATYIINRIPSKVLKNKTPFEVLHEQKQKYNLLRTFGCLCYATTHHKEHKFSPRTFKGIFMGYPPNTKGYLILDLENEKFHINRDVVFREDIFPLHQTKPSFSN